MCITVYNAPFIQALKNIHACALKPPWQKSAARLFVLYQCDVKVKIASSKHHLFRNLMPLADDNTGLSLASPDWIWHWSEWVSWRSTIWDKHCHWVLLLRAAFVYPAGSDHWYESWNITVFKARKCVLLLMYFGALPLKKTCREILWKLDIRKIFRFRIWDFSPHLWVFLEAVTPFLFKLLEVIGRYTPGL